jgi:hypothetical protein
MKLYTKDNLGTSLNKCGSGKKFLLALIKFKNIVFIQLNIISNNKIPLVSVSVTNKVIKRVS